MKRSTVVPGFVFLVLCSWFCFLHCSGTLDIAQSKDDSTRRLGGGCVLMVQALGLSTPADGAAHQRNSRVDVGRALE